MRVIDLINMIANDVQDMPKKIQVLMQNGEREVFIYNMYDKKYYNQNINGMSLLDYISIDDTFRWLNTEIETSDKIEFLNPEKYYFKDGTEMVYKEMFKKINELVSAINEIKRQ